MIRFDETFWVGFSVILFCAIAYRPLKKFINQSINDRIKTIKENIRAAESLAKEAESLLNEYTLKQENLKNEINELMSKTEEQIKHMFVEAEAQLSDSIKQRSEAAMQRITQYETAILDEVRKQAVEIAILAVKSIVRDRLSLKDSEAVVESLIDDITSRIN
ncbi:MAG: hypothetical protein J0H68_00325 [Sphingobacteriia bacterium]|nr:hypothetical protein [Sphingobacteriia bacterium]